MDYKEHTELYSIQDKELMKTAEDSLDPKIDRVEEIIKFAKEAGYKKLGIANCISFVKEADNLEAKFRTEGFEVEKVHCKYGKLPFDKIVPGYKGVACNPAGQAKYLADHNTELNIMMGLCVGHDMLFNSKSAAPVTPLVVKDRKLKHHTLKSLNE
jgi:uncharacterized metal-binding protein